MGGGPEFSTTKPEQNYEQETDTSFVAAGKLEFAESQPHYDPQPAIEALADKINAEHDYVLNALARIQNIEAQLLSQKDTASQTFNFGGLSFTLVPTPKQDAMIDGANSVGRTGMILQVSDGERSYTVAKMQWDHNKKTYVLYTGQGVTG